MHVLFDGYWWHEGPTSNRHVMRNIVITWTQDFPDDEVSVLVRPGGEALARTELPPSANVDVCRLFPHAVAAAIGTASAARRRRPDVTITHNYASLAHPSLVFVHDFMFVDRPEFFTQVERLYFSPMPKLGRRADMVCTTSHTEADRISSVLQRSVTPTGLGLPAALLTAEPEPPVAAPVPRSFMLSVGRLNIRKNVARTIEAVAAAGLATPDFPLLVVGGEDGAPEPRLQSTVERAEPGSVRFLGSVSLENLRWLYENARLSLSMSLDEGFGMPVLESMAFGTPVVASDIPVFREVSQGLAELADPTDATAIVTAIRRELANPLDPARSLELRLAATRDDWSDVVSRIRAEVVRHGA